MHRYVSLSAVLKRLVTSRLQTSNPIDAFRGAANLSRLLLTHYYRCPVAASVTFAPPRIPTSSQQRQDNQQLQVPRRGSGGTSPLSKCLGCELTVGIHHGVWQKEWQGTERHPDEEAQEAVAVVQVNISLVALVADAQQRHGHARKEKLRQPQKCSLEEHKLMEAATNRLDDEETKVFQFPSDAVYECSRAKTATPFLLSWNDTLQHSTHLRSFQSLSCRPPAAQTICHWAQSRRHSSLSLRKSQPENRFALELWEARRATQQRSLQNKHSQKDSKH